MTLVVIVLLLCAVGPASATTFKFRTLVGTVPQFPVTAPYYTERRDFRPYYPSEESLIREHVFDTPLTWNAEDIVPKRADGKYVFSEAITEAVEENVIPELCYLTSQNLTIYNSFLLDRTCLQQFESVSAACAGFKCDLAHWFLEHGARIFGEFFQTETLEEAGRVVEKEVTKMFRDLNMCTCGREFFKAAFKCAPYYYGNALFAALGNDEDDINWHQKFSRNVDLKSLSKVVDRLLEGLCADTKSGLCISNILNVVADLGGMLETTIDDYDRYDYGDRKFQKSQEKRCDALFGPLRTWEQDDRELPRSGHENQYMEILFSKTAAVANSFYCAKSCKKDRNVFYPCCLRTMLEDRILWNNVEKVVQSVFRLVPAMDYYYQYRGFYELYGSFWRSYTQEEFENWKTWTLPENVREQFMRTVNGPKYCTGKIIRCKDGYDMDN